MSHWAELDENNNVIRVCVGNNESPDEGEFYFKEIVGGKWVKTSYNARIRKHYAGIGFYYDEELDAFIPPKPGDGDWVLDSETATWTKVSE